MIPEPLLRVLPYPAFHLVVQELRRCGQIEIAALVPWHLQLRLDFQAVAISGQSDAACRIDVAIELANQLRQQGVRLDVPAEEQRLQPLAELLVDEYADTTALVQLPR